MLLTKMLFHSLQFLTILILYLYRYIASLNQYKFFSLKKNNNIKILSNPMSSSIGLSPLILFNGHYFEFTQGHWRFYLIINFKAPRE